MTAHADPSSDSTPAEDAPTGEATDARPVAADTAATAETDAAATTESDAATDSAAAESDAATDSTAAESDAAEATAPAEPDAAADAAPAEVAPAAEPAPAAVSPRPVPTPRPMPRPSGRPTAAAAPQEPWGRVDEDGTVSVREQDGWRVVGQYPDGTPDEALAYFERKYADLAGEVTLLEARHRRGGASASDLRTTAETLRAKLEGAAAVGDLAALDGRLTALTGDLEAASESEAAAARAAVDEAIATRTALVEQAEALAARDPKTIHWKQASTELAALFDQWQAHQQNGPRLPKSTGQQLWKRFRDARSTVDKHRREFYSQLDEAHKSVRDEKSRLVERAEALAPQGEDGIPAYRALLDQWKSAGRAGKKADDALWARFKAAGDALYAARGEREAAETEASREKIAAKRELLTEAKAVADEPVIAKARTLLTGIQRRWDEIGRVYPRDVERSLDDDLRKVEQALRTREDVDWKRNNPETKARANDMTRQLTESISKLEDELAAAEKSGDARAISSAREALEARQTWLRALGGA